jgi:hypothetical protein
MTSDFKSSRKYKLDVRIHRFNIFRYGIVAYRTGLFDKFFSTLETKLKNRESFFPRTYQPLALALLESQRVSSSECARYNRTALTIESPFSQDSLEWTFSCTKLSPENYTYTGETSFNRLLREFDKEAIDYPELLEVEGLDNSTARNIDTYYFSDEYSHPCVACYQFAKEENEDYYDISLRSLVSPNLRMKIIGSYSLMKEIIETIFSGEGPYTEDYTTFYAGGWQYYFILRDIQNNMKSIQEQPQ